MYSPAVTLVCGVNAGVNKNDMAKYEGTQEIPSELFVLYKGALVQGMPTGVIRKRFPWRLPLFQKGKYKVTDEQLEQRSRFESILEKFKTLSDEDRQRWYAARPPWGSYLWYYNYFMLSGLMGNAFVGTVGGGVIKTIQHKTFTLPLGTPTNVTVSIDTIDPTKAVAFFYGAGYMEAGPATGPYAVEVYPILISLNSSQIIARASMDIAENAGCSTSIIEYI